MPIILYIETNFLLSYATGRDTATDRLVTNPLSSIRLVIPSFCFMEALSVLEGDKKYQNTFIDALKSKIVEAQRNLVSPHIQDLINHLQSSIVELQRMSSDLEARLFHAIDILSAGAEMIEPTNRIIQASFARNIIADPTDNLILASILAHAAVHGSETKAFLTENRKCFFENPYAKAALQTADIKYFSDASRCLEWNQSRPVS
jgi:PIN domain